MERISKNTVTVDLESQSFVLRTRSSNEIVIFIICLDEGYTLIMRPQTFNEVGS